MRRTTITAGTTALIAVALGTVSLTNLANPTASPSPVETPAVAAESTAPLQLNVAAVQDGYRSAQPFATPPPGFRWVAVDVEITNPGSVPTPVAGLLDLVLVDRHGMRYPVQPQTGNQPRIEGAIQPGGTMRGVVVFQLPVSVTRTRLVLQSPSGSAHTDLAL